ncbi:hypothetical protein XANCAGTX0491_006444 [Xanthoria calcicola]
MDSECQVLRLELKEWEKSFALSNQGKKAGREDIRQHPEIAAKYKTYNKLRLRGAADCVGKGDASVQAQLPTKRHTSTQPPTTAHTPQKRLKHPHSPPSKLVEPQNALETAQNSPVAHRKSIGPTPQRNGHVLGLFDLLTPSSSTSTPSKRRSLLPISSNSVVTPVRLRPTRDDKKPQNTASPSGKRTRSPSSASRTSNANDFLTPSKRRIVDVGYTPEAAKPASVLRYDDTPAFLRRDSQRFSQSQQLSESYNPVEDDVFSWSPVAVRVIRPQPAGRGLSALVKGLRDMEEAKLDDELEMLREMEGQGEDDHESQAKVVPKVWVKDSQVPDMPLGPDGEGESEREDLEGLKTAGEDRSGRPLKIWKKKGQKRTTRRVTIKPNTAKWKPEQEWKGGKEDESEEEVVAVGETQIDAPALDVRAEDAEEFQSDEDGVHEDIADQGGQQNGPPGEQGMHIKRSKSPKKEPLKEKKKKAVNAAAHTNYRALKIRSKKSKGKGSGRFSRRR